jgi:hypothetical protein
VRVSTPVATLSVRGSRSWIGFGADSGLGILAQAGNWHVVTSHRDRNVGPGERTDSSLTSSMELLLQLLDPQMGDVFGQTAAEQSNLRNNGGGRGIIGFTGSGTESQTIIPSGPTEPPRKPTPYPPPIPGITNH